MTNDHVFGSDQLSPEMLRSARFAQVDGKVDAAEVQQFLDRVASSLEVFLAQDAPAALRAEFARNAEIAQQVLDAGQTAAEQLRRQAAEEAKRILDEAREATLGLRETVESEIGQAREQVEAMRGGFIQDLRDLYDRIGASLYRFERAAEESRVEPIREPAREVQPAVTPDAFEEVPAPAAVPAMAPEPVSAPEPVAAPPLDPAPAAATELPEGAKAPAWQQLPPEAWSTGGEAEPAPEPVAAPASGEDPFAVVEDEPLAPGEPLVDLRELGAETPPSEDALEVENPVPDSQPEVEPDLGGGSWLDSPTDVAALAPQAGDPSPAAADGGSWLDSPTDPATAEAAEQPADVARDDALAEALIAGDAAPIPAPILDSPVVADPAAAPVPAPAQVEASQDSMALRNTILELSAAGHSREAIVTFLREQFQLPAPEPLVAATLGPETA